MLACYIDQFPNPGGQLGRSRRPSAELSAKVQTVAAVCMSRPPACGCTRIGRVGAIRSGADGAAEMLAELGMVFTDPGNRLADRTGTPARARSDADAARRSRPPKPNACASSRTRKSRSASGLCGPLGVPVGAGLLDVVFDLGEASTVGVLGSRVDHLARVAERGAPEVVRLPAAALRTAAGLGGDEIEHVVFPAGFGEEPGDVPHALEVADMGGVSVEDHRPVVALATEHVGVPGRLLGERGLWCSTCTGRPAAGAAAISSRIVRAASRSRTARCSAPRAAWASARPGRASAASYGAPLRSRVALPRTATVRRTPHRRRRAAPFRERGWHRQSTRCSRTVRPHAPARRRPIVPGRSWDPPPQAVGRADGVIASQSGGSRPRRRRRWLRESVGGCVVVL